VLVCGNSISNAVLAEAHWYPFWNREDRACPACVQQNSSKLYCPEETRALHEANSVGMASGRSGAFGVIPTRLRMHSIPGSPGKGVTIALVERWLLSAIRSGAADNRIRLWADATHDPVSAIHLSGRDAELADWNGSRDWQCTAR